MFGGFSIYGRADLGIFVNDMEPSPDVPKKRRGRKRRWIIVGVAFMALLAALAFFLPYLLKRYIEKHSVEWIDRKVTIDYIVLNPFTFRYGVYGVKCYEPNSPEVFVSWEAISLRSNLWRGFRDSNWRFTHVRIRKPYFHIVQQKDRFNFSDLMELGGTDSVSTDTSTTRFSMEDIRLEDGRIDYISDIAKAPLAVERLNVTSNRITSDNARMEFALTCGLASGGDLDGGFTIDTDRSLYAINGRLRRFALPQLLPYLQDFMRAKDLQGGVDLDLALQDSWADTTSLAVSAKLDLDDMAITDANGQHLIGLKKGLVRLDTLNAKNNTFKLSRVLVDGLDTRYQQWADGSNTWTKALLLDSTSTGDSASVQLAASESNVFVMLADYIRMLGQEFVANQYTADSVVLTHAKVEFEDFTPEKPFRYTLNNVDVRSSRISTASGSADFSTSALLNGRGRLQSMFRFDPKDFRNVKAEMTVDDLALQDLDAYSRWYAAYPLQQGVLTYTSHTSVQNGMLDSENHMLVDKLRFGKKTDAHDTGIYVLPLRLAGSLLKDVHGRIDLDIPVKGDLRDPSFRVWPIVWQVLKNLVVKAGTAPVRLVAGAFEGVDEQDLESVRFAPTQIALDKPQRKPLDMLAKLLAEKPELTVALVPLLDKQQTQEEWAAFAAKRRYLKLDGALSEKDSAEVAQLSLRDEAFEQWLDAESPATKGRPERSRCLTIVGPEAAREAVKGQEDARKNAVLDYLKGVGLDGKRCTLRPGTKEETAGFTGDPGYRFVFDSAE